MSAISEADMQADEECGRATKHGDESARDADDVCTPTQKPRVTASEMMT